MHEAANRVHIPEACQSRGNVRVEELKDGGIAALHAQRILEGIGSTSDTQGSLQRKLELLFKLAPASLSEFKPAWGWVFSQYLHQFSHWTYTDADVIFGRFHFGRIQYAKQPHLGLTTGLVSWILLNMTSRLGRSMRMLPDFS